MDLKIAKTQNRIREWYNYYGGEVYVSFSGGKDSAVLLDIARIISMVHVFHAMDSENAEEYKKDTNLYTAYLTGVQDAAKYLSQHQIIKR